VKLPQLEKRERIVVAGGAAAAVLIVGDYLISGPLEAYQQSRTRVIAAQQALTQAQTMHRQVVESRSDREAVEQLLAVREGSNLFSTVTRAIQTVNLTDRAEMQSQPRLMANAQAVQISLTGVSMTELVDLLHELFSDNLVVLHQLTHLRPAQSGQGLDCAFVLIQPSTE